LIPLIGGLILYVVIQALVKAPGSNLQGKFVGLGTLKGRTKDEIISVVGPPNSISAAANGKTLYQWIATGYHIALLFDGSTCEGITHQFKVR
jgi:hypothetical protein